MLVRDICAPVSPLQSFRNPKAPPCVSHARPVGAEVPQRSPESNCAKGATFRSGLVRGTSVQRSVKKNRVRGGAFVDDKPSERSSDTDPRSAKGVATAERCEAAPASRWCHIFLSAVHRPQVAYHYDRQSPKLARDLSASGFVNAVWTSTRRSRLAEVYACHLRHSQHSTKSHTRSKVRRSRHPRMNTGMHMHR
jgi:hypothetical protein